MGGRLADRIGPRTPIIIGCATMLVSCTGFALLTVDTPLAVVGVVMALQGAGFGMASSPALVAGLSDLPPALLAQGTAIRSLTREVSGSVSIAVLGAVVALRMGRDPSVEESQAAYNAAFALAAVGVAVAIGLALLLPKGLRRPAVKVDASTVALAAE